MVLRHLPSLKRRVEWREVGNFSIHSRLAAFLLIWQRKQGNSKKLRTPSVLSWLAGPPARNVGELPRGPFGPVALILVFSRKYEWGGARRAEEDRGLGAVSQCTPGRQERTGAASPQNGLRASGPRVPPLCPRWSPTRWCGPLHHAFLSGTSNPGDRRGVGGDGQSGQRSQNCSTSKARGGLAAQDSASLRGAWARGVGGARFSTPPPSLNGPEF